MFSHPERGGVLFFHNFREIRLIEADLDAEVLVPTQPLCLGVQIFTLIQGGSAMLNSIINFRPNSCAGQPGGQELGKFCSTKTTYF